jgi:tetratricopeptide (TPR) repeat protein
MKRSEVLQAALKQAKNGSFEKAQALVAELDESSLSTEDLRTLALVHSYCDQEHDSERVREKVCGSQDAGAGDFFMLASTQIGLGLPEKAIGNLRRAIAESDRSGQSYYLSSAVINLAVLLADRGGKEEARQLLGRLSDADAAYIPGVGQLTRQDLVKRLGTASPRPAR